jgi:type IV pilus assembly protein PilZ
MSTAPTTPRPSVMQLAIKEKAALYAAYIPMFAEGGIGIQFPKDEKSAELRAKIENILGTALGSDKATQTV